MKIKKVLLALIVAIFAVIGCTSCGAKKIGSTTETTPTVVVTRPDYGENVKIHIINTGKYAFDGTDELEEQTNEWLLENKDKTILSIELHNIEGNSMQRYGFVLIVYRDNGTTTPQQ